MPDPTRQSLSATETPALFNASPYTTPWMLYQKFANDNDPKKTADGRMDWGKKMQRLVLEQVEEEKKLVVRPNHGDIYVRNGLIGCTRDAEIICPTRGPGALEIKVVFDYRVWMREWLGGAEPPRHIDIQLQSQMKVGNGTTPYNWGMIAVWLAAEVHYFERAPIEKLWAGLDERASDFFDAVANKREPDPFGMPQEVPLLLECYPTIQKSVMDLRLDGLDMNTEEGMAEIHRRTKLAQRVAMMKFHAEERLGNEKAEKAIKAEVLALAKGAESIVLPHGVTVNIKQQSRAGYSVGPTTFQTVSCFVPPDAPRGDIYGLEPTNAKQ